MIKTEFGIICDFDENEDYDGYHPEKYNCVAIDDDLYLNDWWEKLKSIEHVILIKYIKIIKFVY